MQLFFFRRETKSSVNDFIVELHGFPFPPYFCYNYNGSTGHDTHDNTDPNFSVDA